MFRPLILSAAMISAPLTAFAQSGPIALDFLPPVLEPRDVCNVEPANAAPDDLNVQGTDEELTDRDRIRFLRRDISNHMDEDADSFFDFIQALIARRAAIDDSFTEVDATFARINLMLRAGRFAELAETSLVENLRTQVPEMTNGQRVALARFFADGTGVEADPAYAQTLIREAAYGGNPQALLEIVRLEEQGALIEKWDAPLDLTITMAFGGILGGMDRSLCRRAERIAQEYIDGDVVAANPALALAWFRFAADMGGARAAWRVVEFHLNADAAVKDNIELRHYLKQAVRLGVAVDADAGNALVSSGAIDRSELEEILGFNHSQDERRRSTALSPLLQLRVNIDGLESDDGGLFIDYLREISMMPEAPGRVFDRLAGQVLVGKGRWAGEAEAMSLLEEAVARGDGPGQRRLARMLVRYRDDPSAIARAESLLMELVSRHGMPVAMRDLNSLYRCQVNDAPRVPQADPWRAAYAASGHAILPISATDLLALSLDRSPEAIAKIQSQALDGRAQMLAAQAQRVQDNPQAAATALRFWAKKVNQSDQALEAFAELEFELATTPAQRDIAIEFFRRVYLNNGVTTALDLAIALVEYNARDPEIAREIEHLLTMAGNRGEGGAIRLLSRLQADKKGAAEIHAQFADKIEARGDFLALMFAIPFISAAQVDDYIDRAVSLMTCGTKDADEVGDAHAIRGNGPQSYRWRQIGLHFEGGHVLSKLRLTNRQIAWFDDGSAPDPVARATQALAEGDSAALMQLIGLTANADLSTYDANAATGHILVAMQQSTASNIASVVAIYLAAPQEVKDTVDTRIDLTAVLDRAAKTGDVASAYTLGMMLRDRAQSATDLAHSLDWLEAAAKQGHREAMFEAGYALGFGLGRAADYEAAITWLDQARAVGHPQAATLAQTFRIKGRL